MGQRNWARDRAACDSMIGPWNFILPASFFVGWCLILGCSSPAKAVQFFQLEDQVLTVTTDRYRATFEWGALTSLHNRLTGETYAHRNAKLTKRLKHLPHGLASTSNLTKKTMPELAQLHQRGKHYDRHSVWASYHHPDDRSRVSLQRRGDRQCVVTWQGLSAFAPERHDEEAIYRLDIEILPGCGDLAILASGLSRAGGVYGVGFVMANFSRDLKFIAPLYQGCWFKPSAQGLFTSVSHWPRPWHASLLIAEGETGSVGMWMADPQMGDRYLHLRNNDSAFDIGFESVNHAPFEDLNDALSRPIRINVYQGSWVRPAKAFQSWWASTFDVKPLDQRPPFWLSDIGALIDGSGLPPAPLAPRTVYAAMQHWRQGASFGEYGLFPINMEQGPKLKNIKRILKPYHAQGGHMMVYQNISHMTRGHPKAPSFWAHQLTDPFQKSRPREPPSYGDKGKFVVHCASRSWQNLVLSWAQETYRRYGIRGFYMDCASGEPNSESGKIEGKNDCQGELELMRRMKASIPGCFLGVEYANEVTAQVCDMGMLGYDGWFKNNMDFLKGRQWRETHVHPILSMLFGPYTYLWTHGYSLATFHETLGRIPETRFVTLPPGSSTDYSQRQTFEQLWARLRCTTLMKPTYPDDWPSNVRAYYADPQNNQYRIYADTPGEGRMVKTTNRGETLVYWRIKGRNQATLTHDTGIGGWIAYDGKTAIGLSPKRTYLYTGEPRIRDWEVSKLPENCYVSSCRPYKNGLLVLDLRSRDGQPQVGEVELVSWVKLQDAIGSDPNARLRSMGKRGRRFAYGIKTRIPGTVAFTTDSISYVSTLFDFAAKDQVHYACLNASGLRETTHKKRLRSPDKQKNIFYLFPTRQGCAYLDFALKLPTVGIGEKLLLRFSTSVPRNAKYFCRISVFASGEQLSRVKREGGTPTQNRTIDLTNYAGRKCLLSFAVDESYLHDYVRIRNPQIVRGRE